MNGKREKGKREMGNQYAERKAEKAAAGRIGFWGWFAWLFIWSVGLSHEKTWGSLLILADLFFLGVIIYRRVQFSRYVNKLAKEKKREMQAPATPQAKVPYLEQLPAPRPSTPEPPGWYQDPNWPNSERYWDGNAWTTHVMRKDEEAS